MTAMQRLAINGAIVSVRAIGDDVGNDAAPIIEGYAALFDVPSLPLEADEGMSFVETIRKGAFSRAISEKQDVRCLFNHESDWVLARTTSGTLTLREDERGLWFTATLPSSTRATDVYASIQRGDVSQCSFAFQVKSDTWRTQDGNFYREVVDVDLFDVGPVTFPAYTATSVQTRVRVPSSIIQPEPQQLTKPHSWYKARARVLTLAQQY